MKHIILFLFICCFSFIAKSQQSDSLSTTKKSLISKSTTVNVSPRNFEENKQKTSTTRIQTGTTNYIINSNKSELIDKNKVIERQAAEKSKLHSSKTDSTNVNNNNRLLRKP